jgi:general secretion pathway protein D
VLGICRELDASPAQERMTRVYRLRNAQAPDVETTLRNFLDQERARLEAALGQEGLGAAQRLLEHEVAVVAEENTNALLLSASPRYFNTILDMIGELDTPPPQVLIQVLLAEVRLDDDVDLGIDWNLRGEFGSDDDKAFNVDTTFGPEALFGTTGFSVSVTGADFGFFLRALQTQGRLEVLSRPSILTADNQEGRITVGQRVPFITNSRVTEEGTTINTIQYENVAIELLVLPHINPDGTVRMEIQPQISSIAESTVEISEGVNAIIVDTREAATTLTVQDGHTVVIGGLITTDESSTENKVPFFGDLPVLGPLFKRTSKSQERRELLIILTPTVIRNATESDVATERQLERLNELRSMQEGEARDFRPHDVLYPAPLRKRERPPIRDARMRKRGLLIEHEDDGDTSRESAVRRETDEDLPPIPAPANAEEEP